MESTFYNDVFEFDVGTKACREWTKYFSFIQPHRLIVVRASPSQAWAPVLLGQAQGPDEAEQSSSSDEEDATGGAGDEPGALEGILLFCRHQGTAVYYIYCLQPT